jgi:hypothetical protein
MRMSVIICVAVLLIAVLVDIAGANNRGLGRCAPKHAKVLVSNAQVQVYGKIK